MPTTLRISSSSPELDAVSLVPVLQGDRMTTPRDLHFCRREGDAAYGGTSYEAIIRGDWKLLQNDPFRRLELDILQDDPSERVDLSATNERTFNETSLLPPSVSPFSAAPWPRPRPE